MVPTVQQVQPHAPQLTIPQQVVTPTPFEPWAEAAAARASTAAAQHGHVDKEGTRMEPPDLTAWRSYEAPTTQYPSNPTAAQTNPEAFRSPSYGPDPRMLQSDPAQTTGAEHLRYPSAGSQYSMPGTPLWATQTISHWNYSQLFLDTNSEKH